MALPPTGLRCSPIAREHRHERVFILTLRAPRDEARTTRALRWVLKELLRRHGLTCVDIQEITETMEESA